MRPLLALGAGVLAGLVAAAIWTWAQPNRYRADARVLVRPDSSRIVPAVQALAESSLVATNVQQTLRLSSPPRVSARTGKGAVLTVSVEAGSRERARQIDAEAVTILTQKVAQRFATIVKVNATVLDPAHAAEQTSPTPRRNFLIAGLAGLVAGVIGAGALLSRRPHPSAPVGDPQAEGRLGARIDEVAKREHALARRAGELAAREHDLARREQELVAAAVQPIQPEPEPEPEPAPEPVEEVATGGWNLRVLEGLVDAHRAANPAAGEEWSTYLFFLRQHADVDGVLPSSFNALVADVFGNVPGVLTSRDE